MAVGGLLNISCLVSRGTVLLYLTIGLLVFLAHISVSVRSSQIRQQDTDLVSQKDKWLISGMLLIILLVGIQFAVSVRGRQGSGILFPFTDFKST